MSGLNLEKIISDLRNFYSDSINDVHDKLMSEKDVLQQGWFQYHAMIHSL